MRLSRGHFLRSCTMAAGAVLAAAILASCGGGGSGGPVVDDTDLARAKTLGILYASSGSTTGFSVVAIATTNSFGQIDDPLAPSLPSQLNTTFTSSGLTIHSSMTGSSTGNAVTSLYSLSGQTTVTGTISGLNGGASALNGTTVNLQATANVAQSSGTLAVSGTFTRPGQAAVQVTLNETLGINGTVRTMHQTSSLTSGGFTLYTSNITNTLNTFVSPLQLFTTLDSTATDPNNPSVLLHITANEVTTFATGGITSSGTVVLSNNNDLQAVLNVQITPAAGLNASGPVKLSGIAIGTLYIVNGTVQVS